MIQTIIILLLKKPCEQAEVTVWWKESTSTLVLCHIIFVVFQRQVSSFLAALVKAGEKIDAGGARREFEI